MSDDHESVFSKVLTPSMSSFFITGRVLKICFVSDISLMNNLDFAIRILAMVKVEILFTICGPIEGIEYWEKCERSISMLPSNVRVRYESGLSPCDVRSTLEANDLFFFPSLGEAYGNVVYEALSAGLPVLLSDQTPWDEVSESCVGWTFALRDEKCFVAAIESVAAWDDVHREMTRGLCKEFVRNLSING